MDNFKNMTALDIEKTTFKIKFRGYDVDQVKTFLSMLAASWTNLMQENKELSDKIKGYEVKIREYEQIQTTLKETLINAEKYITERKENADREAHLIINEAHFKAEQMLAKTNEKLIKINQEIENAQIEKQKFLSDFKNMIDNLSKVWEIYNQKDKK